MQDTPGLAVVPPRRDALPPEHADGAGPVSGVDDDAARIAADLPGATVEAILKRDRYAVTARVQLADGRRVVWKGSVVRVPPGVRVAAAARSLARREARNLERLEGIEGIPRFLGHPSPDSILRAWIDGTTLRERADVPDATFPALRGLVARIHARGVAYADLAKEDNVVVDAAGRPWLIDFQIAFARRSWLGPLVPLLQRADRFHLARHVLRRRPDLLTDEDREILAHGKGLLARFHRAVVKPAYNVVTRRLVRRWSGAGEERRAGELRRGADGRRSGNAPVERPTPVRGD